MRRITKIFVAFLWLELLVFLVGLKPILGYVGEVDIMSKLSLMSLTLTITTSIVLAVSLHMRLWWANFASYFYALLHFFVLGPIGLAFGLTGVIVTWYQLNAESVPDPEPEPANAKVEGTTVIAADQPRTRLSARDQMFGLLAAATQLLTAIGGWWWVTDQALKNGLPRLEGFQMVIWLAVCVVLTIVTHEVGHVVGALAAGMRFRKICVGPLVISNLADGWHMHWTRATLYGGYAIAAPKSENELRVSTLLFVAGGPIFTLLIGVGSFSAFLAAIRTGSGLAELVGLLGVWMLASFAVNALPYRGTRGFSDGARILHLMLRQPEGERLLHIMRIAMSECTPLRPRDWRSDWMDSLLEDRGSPAYMRGCHCRYVSALDSHKTSEAARWLNEFLAVPRDFPAHDNAFAFALEGAYFEARYRGNGEAAAKWLKIPAGESPVERSTILRAHAAVQAATGQREEMRKTIAQARTFVATSEQTGWTLFESDLLDDLERWAESSEELSRLRRAVSTGEHTARKITGEMPAVTSIPDAEETEK